jgi:hypothetical protein
MARWRTLMYGIYATSKERETMREERSWHRRTMEGDGERLNKDVKH